MDTIASQSAATPNPVATSPALPRPAFVMLAILAGISFVAHMLVASNYGYFRDELYYLADGRHLQAGYVDQPLLMGWIAALMRVIAGDNLVAIHVVPALACSLIVVITGLMARELGGGRAAQLTAGMAAAFALDFMATGSLFSMDVLDQLWWALVSLLVIRLLRKDLPRLWLVIGVVLGIALLTKLTVLFLGFALFLAMLVTAERRHLRTPWPYLAAVIAGLGLLPYLLWNALNGWPTWQFWHHYGGVGANPLDFLAAQVGQMNPIAFPLAVAGLVFYFRPAGARYRLLGWVFISLYVVLTVLRVKAYFLAPAYPIVFASGAVALERLRLRSRLDWFRPAYVAVLALAGILLAPAVMPILPPATTVRTYGPLGQVLADRFGWVSLTHTVERVYGDLPPAEQAQACVLASNYGEAGALQQLAPPGRLPPVISGHNNYFLWGPGECTGKVLILVGYSPRDVHGVYLIYAHASQAAVHRCKYCVDYERTLPIFVLSAARKPIFPRRWASLKSFS